MYQELRPSEQKLSKYKKGMKKTSRKYCINCVFYNKGYGISNECCTYLLCTHERRGCPIGYCDKFSTNPDDILYDWSHEGLYDYPDISKDEMSVPDNAYSTVNQLNEDI